MIKYYNPIAYRYDYIHSTLPVNVMADVIDLFAAFALFVLVLKCIGCEQGNRYED